MRKTALIFLVFSGILALSAAVISQSPIKTQRIQNFTRHKNGHLLRVLNARKEELKITDEQLSQIKEKLMKAEEKRVEHQNIANTHKLEVKKWHMATEKQDYNSLRILLNKNAQSRTEMLISQVQLRDQINQILTEEQRETIKNFNQNRMGRGRGRGILNEKGHRSSARFRRPPESFQKRFDRE